MHLNTGIKGSVRHASFVQVQEVAAPAYARLLAEAAYRLGPCTAFYALWPLQPVQAPWAALTSALFAELAVQRVVHTAARGGAWLAPDQAVYTDGAVQRCLPVVYYLKVSQTCCSASSSQRLRSVLACHR